MDPSSYKDITTSRGLKYHYFISRGDADKPTLLFLHGFPSTSYTWRYQVPFFQKEGYGLIVPDLLGYGGTDKPVDVASYRRSGVGADLIDILDAEKINKVIPIAHDVGCHPASWFASVHPERFLAYGFLTVPYMPPSPDFNFEEFREGAKKAAGYELYGYSEFLCEDDAAKIIEGHWDSFLCMVHPEDPEMWKTDMCPTGRVKQWILNDKKRPFASYIVPAELQKEKAALMAGGMTGPNNWFKVVAQGLNAEDDKNVPKENYIVKQPVFYGGALQDYVCLPWLAKALLGQVCQNVTVKDFNTDHWLQLAAPEEVNRELLVWIKGLKV